MEPTLDTQAIENLKRISGGSSDLVKRVVGAFLRNSPDILERLKREADTSSWGAMARTAHQLKSGAGYVGASRFVQLLNELESPSPGFQLEEAPARVRDLLAEYERVKTGLDPYLS